MSLAFSRMDTLTLFLPPDWLTKSSYALIVFARFAAASRMSSIPTAALSDRHARPATKNMTPQTNDPGLNFRVRVHGRDVAKRDRLRGRSERDHTQQGVWALVYHAHAARGDAGPEPEQDHGRAEPVADDAGLPRRVGEFGHGLLCFGHFSFLSLVFIAKVEDDAAILVDDERGVEFAALP